MKTTRLLHTLEMQVADLDRQLAPLAAHRSPTPRFDRQRFATKGRRMQDYLDEIHAGLVQVQHYAVTQKTEQLAWLAETLALQIAALQREAASWQLRAHDSAHSGMARLHKKLLEHQEFERRLLEMKFTREAQLQSVDMLAEQQRLHREIDALDGRISRCRDALAKIETALARYNR